MIAIRRAAEADAPALASVAVAAYRHYVPRIGQPPAPMTADDTAAIRRSQAWVAAMTENLPYYPRHGYTETHRAHQDGFQRVFFSKRVDT